MKKTFVIMFAFITLTFVGCGSSESTAIKTTDTAPAVTVTSTEKAEPRAESEKEEESTATEPKETEPVETESAPVETTTVETESEPEVTTTEDLGPAPDLECLANSHEISIDDLPAEDKAMFEQFIKENGLKGRFYDHIDVIDDIPTVYFIPSYELLSNEDLTGLFDEKIIWMFCTKNDADKYFSVDFSDYYLSDNPMKYVLVRDFIGRNLNQKLDISGFFFFDSYIYPFLDDIPVFIPAE